MRQRAAHESNVLQSGEANVGHELAAPPHQPVVFLSRQPRADSRLSTSGGGITLQIAPNVSVDLDAHTSGGDVDTEVPVTLLGRQNESSIEGKVNGGGPKLVLRSSGGDIRIRKL